MGGCLYDKDACDSERTVIISELQGNENDPDQLLDTELTATAFKAHPYRHPTIGWLSDLETMSRDDLYGYYRRHYIPNNATLVVVGDVSVADALRRAAKAFSGVTAGPAPSRIRTAEPPQGGERRVTPRTRGHDRVSEGRLSRAGRRPPRLCADARPRRGPDRREGAQPVDQLSWGAATAPCASLSRAGGPRSGLVGRGRARRHPGPVSLRRVGHGGGGPADVRRGGGDAGCARRGA